MKISRKEINRTVSLNSVVIGCIFELSCIKSEYGNKPYIKIGSIDNNNKIHSFDLVLRKKEYLDANLRVYVANQVDLTYSI